MRYWNDCRQFYRQFREQFTTTGSIIPSSRALARALTRPLRRTPGPRRLIEVGPGTGAVTAEIVRQLRPDERLDIVELNGSFVAHLEQRFATEPDFRRVRGQCRLLHSPIQQVEGQACYDFMVSGIPLANFGVALVEDVFRSYERLLAPEGTLSYFEYLHLRTLKLPFVPHRERERLLSLAVCLNDKVRRYQVAEEVVFLNFPPAVARHFCFGKGVRANSRAG
jgi:phospholipid N-methyltransferase